MNDDREQLIENWGKIEQALFSVLEKHQHSFSEEEKVLCNELISSREYSEGFENLIVIIKTHNIALSEEFRAELKLAAELMNLSISDYD